MRIIIVCIIHLMLPGLLYQEGTPNAGVHSAHERNEKELYILGSR